MNIFIPAYYDNFHCIAAACPDSCCKEWAVDVDDQSAAYYRQLSGVLGERLRAVLVDTDDGVIMQIENNRCPMWQQDGLCRIQAELGHDDLCKTCRDFPRLHHDYGNFVELGLELSCPEAARIILTATDHSIINQEIPGGEEPEYEEQTMRILLKSRQQALALLDDDRYSLPEKLAILLLYGYGVQGEIDGGEELPFDSENLLNTAHKYASNDDMPGMFTFFRSLEILTPQWRQRLERSPSPINWSAPLTELARYLILRYWLQAVSDFDLICRVKFIIISCLLVGALGGDPIQTAQLFSKEIENDLDNLEAILDGTYTSPSLTDRNLLSLLLL